jgi:hypothetical protein
LLTRDKAHHNIFGLFNGQHQLLGQAKERLLSLLFQYHIKFDNSFSDTIEEVVGT